MVQLEAPFVSRGRRIALGAVRRELVLVMMTIQLIKSDPNSFSCYRSTFFASSVALTWIGVLPCTLKCSKLVLEQNHHLYIEIMDSEWLVQTQTELLRELMLARSNMCHRVQWQYMLSFSVSYLSLHRQKIALDDYCGADFDDSLLILHF